MAEKANVGFETLFGSIEGNSTPKTFQRMTIIQTEKAVTFKKR